MTPWRVPTANWTLGSGTVMKWLSPFQTNSMVWPLPWPS